MTIVCIEQNLATGAINMRGNSGEFSLIVKIGKAVRQAADHGNNDANFYDRYSLPNDSSGS
jgi:hypothetical protein